MKICMTGDLGYTNSDEFTTISNRFLEKFNSDAKIVTGKKEGTEELARGYAKANGFKRNIIDTDDLEAINHVRLTQGVDYAIVFWNGQDLETYDFLVYCLHNGIKVITFYYAD